MQNVSKEILRFTKFNLIYKIYYTKIQIKILLKQNKIIIINPLLYPSITITSIGHQ